MPSIKHLSQGLIGVSLIALVETVCIIIVITNNQDSNYTSLKCTSPWSSLCMLMVVDIIMFSSSIIIPISNKFVEHKLYMYNFITSVIIMTLVLNMLIRAWSTISLIYISIEDIGNYCLSMELEIMLIETSVLLFIFILTSLIYGFYLSCKT